mgnify:CR=1 FL=1
MNKVKELEDKIIRYKKSYYQGQAEISDVEYDELEEELKNYMDGSDPLSFLIA